MRLDIDTFREIGDSLVRNKRRSLLTGFGVFWGLFMLLFLVGGGAGLKQLLMNNFDGFASNTMIIISSNTSKPYKGMPEGRYWNINIDDMERLRVMVPELDVVTPLISSWGKSVNYGSNTSSCGVKGIMADYQSVESCHLKYGRTINAVDNDQERKVCVIGKRIYNELFSEGGDPCGKFVEMGGIWFRIVGVDFNSGNMSINGQASQSVLIPFTVAAKLYHRGNTVDCLCVTGKSGVKMSNVEPHLRRVMARRHDFDATDDQAMMVFNTEQIFSIIDNLFRGLNFLIWLVGLGTLLAGAIGVSNIMMVTVRERTVEIGIRRAIGAMPGEILSQILMESIALTLAAGSAGIVFSVLMLRGLEAINKNQVVFQISFTTAVVAALLLSLLGALAGLAPALHAMNVKPVEAMRDE